MATPALIWVDGTQVLSGPIRKARLFPCVAFKLYRGAGAPSANLLLAGKQRGQASSSPYHTFHTHL